MTITYEGATEQTREIVHHHAVLRRGLERRAGTLCAAVENGVPYEQPLAALREYLEGEVLPHAEAEERTCTGPRSPRPAERAGAHADRRAPHPGLPGRRLQPSAAASAAAPITEWIATLFAGHVAKENDLLLPALASLSAISRPWSRTCTMSPPARWSPAESKQGGP